MLPDGVWHDFWTGKALNGGIEIQMPASTERNPVYVRGGSTVVRDVGLFAGAPETRRLTARVYGDESLPFTMQANGEKGASDLERRKGKQ